MFLLTAFAVLLAGCGREPADGQGWLDAIRERIREIVGRREVVLTDNVAALVNGRPIMMGELAANENRWTETPGPAERTRDVRRKILDQLITEELLVQEARRRGLSVSAEEVERAVGLLRRDFPDGAFEEMLVSEYVDQEAWREKLRRNLLIEKVTELELDQRVKVTAQDWSEFYKAHRHDIEPLPQRIRVKHLTAADRKEAEKVRREILDGRDFDEAAGALAGDEDRIEGLEPIWVQPDGLPDPLAQAVRSTPVGEMSPVVESEYGFVVFQVLEIEKARSPRPEEIMARLRRRYLETKRAEAYDRWVGELRQQAEIVINPALAA